MQTKFSVFLVLMPICASLLSLGLPRRIKGFFSLLVSLTVLVFSLLVFGKESTVSLGKIGFGVEFSFRLYHFSSFIVAAASVFTFLTALYTFAFFKEKNDAHKFSAYLLLSLGFVNGAVLANNFVAMLFFWEGLLLVMFGMIAYRGGIQAFKTAIKAFVIVGIADLCMMAGIALVGHISGTLTISEVNLSTGGLASIAFVLLMMGAISKAGSMPYHTWIPDAATDAPLPFMAYFPAALEKLLGIYFLTRICLDLFKLQPGSGLSILLMSLGAITIILAVMMALVQKDYKRLLSYHAISQVGYMVLGVGTAMPIGIIGGLFHMINNALYKSCLFFTAGAVEKEAGTTDLHELGGLARKMPFTFISFLIAAVSISGVPPFNGFFSKELVYDAALESGAIFYIAALLGSFFTAASFLKLGHAVYLGKPTDKVKEAKEAPISMLIVMLSIAICCIIFGIFNYLPLNNLIQPVMAGHLGSHSAFNFPVNVTLIIVSIFVLMGAFVHHLIGAKINGSALGAVDHIYNSAILHRAYVLAEKKYLDPYEIGLKITNGMGSILWWFDRLIDWFYNGFIPGVGKGISVFLSWLHNGNYVTYIIWSLLGAGATVVFITR